MPAYIAEHKKSFRSMIANFNKKQKSPPTSSHILSMDLSKMRAKLAERERWKAEVDKENRESYEESENRRVAAATVDGLKLKVKFRPTRA